MKQQKIRQGVFETNSSSTHSICIAKDVQVTLPKSLHFEFGEFGWECDEFCNTATKASYLYTGMFGNGREDDIANMIATLERHGIAVTKEEAIYKGEKWASKAGYVDHSDELAEFIDAVMADEQMLLRYLFSDMSYIITGNDNGGEIPSVTATYPHDEFYKGN